MEHEVERIIREEHSFVIEGYLNALFHSYVSGYYLDLDEARYYAIGQEKTYSDLYDTQGEWIRFDDYIDENIHPADRELLREVSRIDYIKERLKKERSYSIEVRDLATGKERWFLYTTMRGADDSHAAISFKDVTKEVKQREELHNSYEEQYAQLEEIKSLNELLKDKQFQLEEAMAEQEAQLEEITSLNEMLTENQKKLEVAVDAAGRANRAKSDFLSKMSHDIRTPLNIIVGMTEIAERNSGDIKKIEKCLDTINKESIQLKILIDDILDISAIESGKFKIKPETICIWDLEDDLSLAVQSMVENRKLEYSFESRGILHPYIKADMLRLEQICQNLLSNSVKYTPDGGKVKFEMWQNTSDESQYVNLNIRVSDTGIGISREFMDEMFSDFTRETDSRVSKIQGTGLGLSIVKQIVDMMGGDIEVESKPGKGSIFHVTLPMQIAKAPRNAVQNDLKEPDYSVFKGLKVLLAEDNDLNFEIAEELLNDYGMEITRAENGRVVLEKFNSLGDFGFDLILMDVQMPGLDGIEATRIIRSLDGDYAKKIPIIAMTANSFYEDIQSCIDAGMDGHIAKPIDVRRLFNTIFLILNGRK